MKLYSSFLVRCWVIREEAEEKVVFDIEHIQKGEHLRAATPAEAMEWIIAASQSERDANEAEADN
ncbi:MAG: hypothetical protein ACREEM_39200 [Blastocatellia bacterium]